MPTMSQNIDTAIMPPDTSPQRMICCEVPPTGLGSSGGGGSSSGAGLRLRCRFAGVVDDVPATLDGQRVSCLPPPQVWNGVAGWTAIAARFTSKALIGLQQRPGALAKHCNRCACHACRWMQKALPTTLCWMRMETRSSAQTCHQAPRAAACKGRWRRLAPRQQQPVLCWRRPAAATLGGATTRRTSSE